jgi:hypothetical protein
VSEKERSMSQAITFTQLRSILEASFARLPDVRRGGNTQYRVRDAAMAAFSVFFMQSASFLAHQQAMQDQKQRNNAQSLFGIEQIPSDPQIRNLLDPIEPNALSVPFWTIFALLEEAGELSAFRTMLGSGPQAKAQWLLSLDGTQYFASSKIHCQRCTVKVRNGVEYYTHTAITPVLVAPGESRVISLEPEFIQPQDGAEKQDCERNAGKRWLLRNAARLAPHAVTMLGDDLYCNQPFCQQVLDQQLNFIFTCKPESHLTLYQEVELLAHLGEVTQLTERHWNGQAHERFSYRYVNQVPLKAGSDACHVNWCELTVVSEETGEQLYHNAFATNHLLSDDNIAAIVVAGRARWKIENENNNVLKHYGYHLEHNFGHGEQYLSMVLVLLNLLAFLCHTVLDLCDQTYKRLRTHLRVRKRFFNDLRTLTHYLCFDSWEHLLHFMYTQLELDKPPQTRKQKR